MSRIGLVGALIGFAAAVQPCSARRIRPPPPPAEISCTAAIAAAEQAHQIPTGLLLAIARVESGRPDAVTGLVQPWPWTINVGGHGLYFENRPQAVAFVADAQRSGAASIDTGCLQVNLQQHPTAFQTLEDAFDPRINANYAAQFLAELHQETGDWAIAAGYYHSRTPELSAPYRLAVATRYPALSRDALAPVPRPPTQLQRLATAWAATLSSNEARASTFQSSQAYNMSQRQPSETHGLLLSAR